jgi:hypothetical protein
VAVTTYGDGCHRRGDTEVRVTGLVATVTPYDYTALPGTPCTRQLVSMRHTAAVTFEQAGTAQIQVRGLDGSTRHAANLVGDTLVVERTVPVR